MNDERVMSDITIAIVLSMFLGLIVANFFDIQPKLALIAGAMNGLLGYGIWWSAVNSSLARDAGDPVERMGKMEMSISLLAPTVVAIAIVAIAVLVLGTCIAYICLPSWRTRKE